MPLLVRQKWPSPLPEQPEYVQSASLVHGEPVGDTVGETVGDSLGERVGETVGDTVGETVGDSLSEPVDRNPKTRKGDGYELY